MSDGPLTDADLTPSQLRAQVDTAQKTTKQVYQPVALRVRLRKGWSYQRIADWLRQTHDVDRSKQSIGRWIRGALEERAEERKELADDYIELQVQQLERQLRMCDATLMQIDEEMEHYEAGEMPASLFREKRKTIDQLRRINESLRTLLGLNEPEKTEVEHNHSYRMEIPVPTKPSELEQEDQRELEDEEVVDAEFEEMMSRKPEMIDE